MSWHIPHALWRGIAGLDLQRLGIPEEADYQRQYFIGRTAIAPADWCVYLAFNLFRMSAILFGIADRAQQGNANAADAVQTGAKAGPLADLGGDIAGI
jgi:aminoglycoside phosphotransferase (APT) family kinase protein